MVVALCAYVTGVPKVGEITKAVVAVAPRVTLRMMIEPVGTKRLLNVQNRAPFAGMVVRTDRSLKPVCPPQVTEARLPVSVGRALAGFR